MYEQIIALFFPKPSLLPWSVAMPKVDKKLGRSADSGAFSLVAKGKAKRTLLSMVPIRFATHFHIVITLHCFLHQYKRTSLGGNAINIVNWSKLVAQSVQACAVWNVIVT